jgi:glycosyltransferase involved in cell wall biosynthesis
MAPVSILHLMNGFGDASISWIVHRLIRQLGQEDYSWHVAGLCGQGTMQDQFRQLNVQLIDFSEPQDSQKFVPLRIRRYLSNHQVRIIHTHTPRTLFQAAAATNRMPSIVHIATKHTLTKSQDRRFGFMITMLDRLGLYLPDCLVPVSQAMYGQIVGQPGIEPDHVRAISNAIPVDQFYAPERRRPCRQELDLSPAELAIGFCGRMEKVKRIDLLLQAFQQVLARHPNTRLVLVGEGSKLPEWQSYAERLSLSHAVIWTGFRTDVPGLLAAIDIYVQPSINEGLSLSILEAMAAGKPVIATAVGGTVEVIIDDLTGVLIPTASPAIIAGALLDLIENSEKRSRLAETAREFVLREYCVERMASSYRRLYDDMLKI